MSWEDWESQLESYEDEEAERLATEHEEENIELDELERVYSDFVTAPEDHREEELRSLQFALEHAKFSVLRRLILRVAQQEWGSWQIRKRNEPLSREL